jgi:hypothetical protein
LNLIPACNRKRSLSSRCQISPPVYHSSHPKCFQVMNIQIVEFDCYLAENCHNTELITCVMIQEMYWQFYGLVYNKLEPQLFLLFDYHKYGELGNNEIFSGMESWEPSAVPSFHPVRLDVHNSKCISTHCTWAKIVLIILLQTSFHVQNYRGLTCWSIYQYPTSRKWQWNPVCITYF